MLFNSRIRNFNNSKILSHICDINSKMIKYDTNPKIYTNVHSKKYGKIS